MRTKAFKEGDRVRLTPAARHRVKGCKGVGEIDVVFEPPEPLAFVAFDDDESGLFRWDQLKPA